MGIEKAAQYGLIGYLADRFLGTGGLATIGAAAWGGLMTPDAGEMSAAYDKNRATLRDTVQNFAGFDISKMSIFGDVADPARTKPNAARAQEEAGKREKKDGIGWGKLLLGGAAAWLGVNMLDNVMAGPFSGGWFAPFMPMPVNPLMSGGLDPYGRGYIGGGGIISNIIMNVLGLNQFGIFG